MTKKSWPALRWPNQPKTCGGNGTTFRKDMNPCLTKVSASLFAHLGTGWKDTTVFQIESSTTWASCHKAKSHLLGQCIPSLIAFNSDSFKYWNCWHMRHHGSPLTTKHSRRLLFFNCFSFSCTVTVSLKENTMHGEQQSIRVETQGWAPGHPHPPKNMYKIASQNQDIEKSFKKIFSRDYLKWYFGEL